MLQHPIRQPQYYVPPSQPPTIPTSSGAFPTPPLIMLILIAFAGYHILKRQEAARDRAKLLAREAAKAARSGGSSSSSSSRALTSSDVRSSGMPTSSMVGNPAPKQISGHGGDPRKDPSSTSFRKNYFLTMQGPGRPALVPFQDGLRPKKGEAEGTMWWDNIPDDAKDMMAPPMDPDKLKAMLKNPYSTEMLRKDIELLKLTKKHKEEQDRFNKVGNVLHALLSCLLCLVDMRLGMASFTFFAWRYFTAAHQKELADTQDEIEEAKMDLMKRISEAKKTAADPSAIAMMQQQLSRL